MKREYSPTITSFFRHFMEPLGPARNPRPLSSDMSLDPLAQAAQVLLVSPDLPMWLCYPANVLNLARSAVNLVSC